MMILKKYLTSSIILLIFLNQLQWANAQNKSTILTGTIKNPIVEDLTIKFFQDNISYEELIFDLKLDQSSHFAAALDINDPINASVIYRNMKFPIFLFPGDSINIFFDALNPAQNIRFSGKGAIQNQWFFESSLEFREYEEEVINEQMIKRSPLDFFNYLERVHIRKKQFLNSWLTGRIIEPKVKNYIIQDLDYWFNYQLFRYPSFHLAVNGLDKLELPQRYYQAIASNLLNNPGMLSNENYVNYLEKLHQFWKDEPDKRESIYSALKEVYLEGTSTLMLADYTTGPVLGSFEDGTTFLATGAKSEQLAELQIGNNFVSGFWQEVITSKGIKGWIHDYGLNKLPVINRQGYDFYNLLVGKTLAYALTKAMYWKDLEATASSIQLVLDSDPDKQYVEFLSIDSVEIEKTSKLNVLNQAETAKIFGETVVRNQSVEIVQIERTGNDGSSTPRPANLPDISMDFKEVATQPFTLKGRIMGAGDAQVALTWIIDPILQRDEKQIIRLNAGGSFSIEIDLQEPSIGSLGVGRDAVDIYMKPGQTLEISLSGTDLSRINFNGPSSAVSNFLLDKENYLFVINPVYNRMIKELDGAGFKAYLEGHKKELQRILGQTSNISFKDLTLMEAEINYWLRNELMNFPWEQPLRLGKDAPMAMSSEYYSFIDDIPINDDASLGNPNYANYLEQVLGHWRNTQGFTNLELAEQRLTGKTAWRIKAQYIASAISRGDISSVADRAYEFVANCPYPSYENEIRRLYNENKGLGVGDPAPSFLLTDIDGKKINLEELKGKVIYLDFWATWCTPCLTQMRNSKQWKKQFDGRPVEFVYVSLDRKASDWSNFLRTQKVQGIHVHAGENKVFLSKVAQLYKVKKLPAVFIINQHGEIEYSSGDPSILNASAEIIQSLL